MSFLGVLANTLTVLLGSCLGLAFRRGLPKRIINGVMTGIGLCTIYIGISGSLDCENPLIMVVSVALGAIAGFLLDRMGQKLEQAAGRLERLGQWVERHVPAGEGRVAQGFVSASLLFCVGAMTVVGSLEAGLTGQNETLYTKALLDLVSAAMLSASLGIGVACAALVVLLGQGALVLLAGALAPLLTEGAISAMSAVGSLLILGLGLNLVGATKIPVANYLPAILLAPAVWWAMTFL